MAGVIFRVEKSGGVVLVHWHLGWHDHAPQLALAALVGREPLGELLLLLLRLVVGVLLIEVGRDALAEL